ncbi:MAG: DHA1 family inner membrane transport protein [Ascidiaceihabitans sp.]|jgi:DHA1 family inner membrane transport protein
MSSTPKFILPVISTCNFLIGVGAFVIIGVLEPLGASLGVAPERAGILMTVYALAYAVLSPVLVSLTGHIGRRRVMTFGLVVFLFSAILSAMATSLPMLAVARVFAAAGAGMFTPVGAAVVAGLFPEDQRARVLAAAMFGFTLAQVLGVPAGSWVAYTFGWRFAFWGVVILNLPCIFLIWTFVPAGLKFQPVSLGDLRSILGNGRMMLAIGFTGLFLGAIYVLYTYFTPMLSQMMGMGRDGITFILVLSGIGAVAGNIIGGIMADRLGWYKTLIILCCAQMILMPIYSFLPLAIPGFVVLTVAWSIAGWSFMAGQQMRLIGLAGPMAPVVLALTAACIYIGAAIGSAIGALVIARFGIQGLGIAAAICASFALANLILSARFPPKPLTGT